MERRTVLTARKAQDLETSFFQLRWLMRRQRVSRLSVSDFPPRLEKMM